MTVLNSVKEMNVFFLSYTCTFVTVKFSDDVFCVMYIFKVQIPVEFLFYNYFNKDCLWIE